MNAQLKWNEESEFYSKYTRQDLALTSDPVMVVAAAATMEATQSTQRRKPTNQPTQLRDLLQATALKSFPAQQQQQQQQHQQQHQQIHLQLLDLLNVRSSAFSQLHGLEEEEQQQQQQQKATLLAGKSVKSGTGKGRGRNVVTVEEEEEQEQPSTTTNGNANANANNKTSLLAPVWKCMLSDGHTTVSAMSLDAIPGLSVDVPLGAKVGSSSRSERERGRPMHHHHQHHRVHYTSSWCIWIHRWRTACSY